MQKNQKRDSDVDTDEEGAMINREEDSSSPDAGLGTMSGGLVTKLTKNDVLMGRGAPSAEYEGNTRLRRIVLGRREDYVNAPKRKDKHRIAVEIIETVYKNKGRFLRRVEEEGKLIDNGLQANDAAWELVTDRTELLSKVKQLLRDIGPEAREKRAARRQERKRDRDTWSQMEGKGTASKTLDSSEEGVSKAQASPSSRPGGGEAATPTSTFPYGSLAQQQAAAFGSTGSLASALQSYPGHPLVMVPPPNQSGLLRDMTSPHILSGPLARSMLPSDLTLLQIMQTNNPSTAPLHLLGYPSSSPSMLATTLRQEQLAREILLQQQRQQPHPPPEQGLPASFYGRTGLYAAVMARQELVHLLRQQQQQGGSHDAYQARQQQQQERHLSQLLGRPGAAAATTTTTTASISNSSNGALATLLARRAAEQQEQRQQQQLHRSPGQSNEPDSTGSEHQGRRGSSGRK
eukprot:scaffold42134_cov252-Amphora_coffeaeformis.AAC.3